MLFVIALCLLVRVGSSTRVSHVVDAFIKLPLALLAFIFSLLDIS